MQVSNHKTQSGHGSGKSTLPTAPLPERATFLQKYNITQQEYESTGIVWEELEAICTDHITSTQELQSVANFIAERLRERKEIHSVKVRIKDPERLAEKLIRKRRERSDFPVSRNDYRTHITDLIGLRAIHLFKHQW
jgi:putative GTP pyrophosphokinase